MSNFGLTGREPADLDWESQDPISAFKAPSSVVMRGLQLAIAALDIAQLTHVGGDLD